MNDIRISFLLCVFNDEPFIEETIESILNQSYNNFELIIVNDGSTDKTIEIINSFDDDRIQLYSKQNSGLADSLNFGLDKCSGEWIARIDGDDICSLDRIEEQVKHISDEVAVIGSFVDIIDENGDAISQLTSLPLEHSDIVNNILNANQSLVHPSVLINKKKLEKVGGYDKRYNVAQDIDIWLRLSKVGNLLNINKKLLSLRKHENNISSKKLYNQTLNAFIARATYYYKKDFHKLNDEEFDRFKSNINKLIIRNNLIEKRENRAILSKVIKQEKSILKLVIIVSQSPNILNGIFAKSTWNKINKKIKVGNI
jgi:glycosyltransferase involved in cell wall biosynthesis